MNTNRRKQLRGEAVAGADEEGEAVFRRRDTAARQASTTIR